jgi:hypothetical protein
MSTSKRATAKPTTAEPKQSETTDGKIDSLIFMSNQLQELQQKMDFHRPIAEFLRPHEDLTMNDLRFFWSVYVVRGKDTRFAYVQGSSVLRYIFADHNLINATRAAEMEIKDKILVPVVGSIQDEVTRIALKGVSANQDEDLAPLT